MSLASTFEGFKAPDNMFPPTIPMTAHILASNLFPIGVLYVREKRHGKPEGVLMALPLAVGLKVTWITEPGIMYVDGAVAPVGAAFEETHGSGRNYQKDDEVDSTLDLSPEILAALGGTKKVEFTEFVNNYFEALRRGVAIPGEVVARLQEALCRAFSEPEFHVTKTEAEMKATIKAHRAERRGKPAEEAEES